MGTWPPSVFPGTTEERDALLSVLEVACVCRRGPDGEALVCGPHSLILNERTVKHLIFYRRWRSVLWPGDVPDSIVPARRA